MHVLGTEKLTFLTRLFVFSYNSKLLYEKIEVGQIPHINTSLIMEITTDKNNREKTEFLL